VIAKRLFAFMLLLAICSATGTAASAQQTPPAARDPAPPTAQGQDQEAGGAEAPPGLSGGSTLSHNFLILMKGSWKPAVSLAFGLILWSVLGAAVFLIAGGVLGWISHRLLSGRGAFETPWSWNRFVKWLWWPLFVLPFALGACWAGAFLGFGHRLKHEIREERVVDKVIANVYCAFALDAAGYEMRGDESLEELYAVLKESEALSDVVAKDLGAMVRDLLEKEVGQGNMGALRKWGLKLLSGTDLGKFVLEGKTEEWSADTVLLLFFAVLQGEEASERFLDDHPESAQAFLATANFFEKIRNEFCTLVSSFVYPNAFMGFLVGWGSPLLLWGLFRLVIWLFSLIRPGEAHGEPESE